MLEKTLANITKIHPNSKTFASPYPKKRVEIIIEVAHIPLIIWPISTKNLPGSCKSTD